MKEIIKDLFLLTGGSFILTSCNDLLDREPLDSEPRTTFSLPKMTWLPML